MAKQGIRDIMKKIKILPLSVAGWQWNKGKPGMRTGFMG